jgi:hypothetical protein
MITLALILAALCAIPSHAADPGGAGTGDAAYQKLADEFLAEHFAWNPIGAVGLGLHEYDGRSPDLSRAAIDAEHQQLLRARERLAAIDVASLSPKLARERRVLLATIEDELMSSRARAACTGFLSHTASAECVRSIGISGRGACPLATRSEAALATSASVRKVDLSMAHSGAAGSRSQLTSASLSGNNSSRRG